MKDPQLPDSQTRRRSRRALAVSLAMIGTAVVLWAGAATFVAHNISVPQFLTNEYGDVYIASAKARERSRLGSDPQSDFGVAFEKVRVAFDEGASAHGWFVPAKGRFAVLLIPASGGSRRAMLPYLKFLHAADYPLLVVDSADYGSGRARWGWDGRNLVKGAVEMLHRKAYSRVAALGVGEGGAAAILAQAEDHQLQAIISDSSYASLGAMLRANPALARLNPAFLQTVIAEYGLILGRQPDDISPEQDAAKIGDCALMVIQNSGDPIVPQVQGRAIFSKAAARKSELWIAASKGHGDAIYEAPDEYAKHVLAFLAANLAAPAAVAEQRRRQTRRSRPDYILGGVRSAPSVFLNTSARRSTSHGPLP